MDLSGHHQDLGMPGTTAATLPNAPNLHDSNKISRLVSPASGTGAAGSGGTNGIDQQDSSKLQMIQSSSKAAQHGGVHVLPKSSGGSSSSSKIVRYRECLKNHAAGIGGHALDGCGEFMPSGEEGSIEALKCAACDCHRNFHKREVEGEPLICDICHMNRRDRNRKAAAIAAGVIATASPPANPAPPSSNLASPSPNLQIPAMPLAVQSSSSSQHAQQQRSMNLLGLSSGAAMDHHGNSALLSSPLSMKKRFRTKFSMDQKERMFLFADKLGWRIQKHDEAAVQQFCADVGVKRHVLKVWMHNNKHTFGKRSSSTSPLVSAAGSGASAGTTGDQSAVPTGSGAPVHHHQHLQGMDSPPPAPPASI